MHVKHTQLCFHHGVLVNIAKSLPSSDRKSEVTFCCARHTSEIQNLAWIIMVQNLDTFPPRTLESGPAVVSASAV